MSINPDYSSIDSLVAALLSKLAYSPITPSNDSIGWALSPASASDPLFASAAGLLQAGGWQDQTQSLINGYNNQNPPVPTKISSFDYLQAINSGYPVPLNEFRVFVNPNSHEVVFTFKGSSTWSKAMLSLLRSNSVTLAGSEGRSGLRPRVTY